MKIIEELESLEEGNNPAFFSGKTQLKSACDTELFELDSVIHSLSLLKVKYFKYNLLIGKKDKYDWSEFTLFGEREETAAEKQKRLEKESKIKEAEKAKIQKQIELLKKRQAKLEGKIK